MVTLASVPMDVSAFRLRLQGLVDAFNHSSLDVPEGGIDRGCTFRLNGVTYAETMGQPLTSPLVRLVALGPAAYRFLAQAVRYAMPDARVDLGDVTITHHDRGGLATGTATLAGTFRGQTASSRSIADFAIVINATAAAVEIGVQVPPGLVAAIADARRR